MRRQTACAAQRKPPYVDRHLRDFLTLICCPLYEGECSGRSTDLVRMSMKIGVLCNQENQVLLAKQVTNQKIQITSESGA